MAKHHAGYYNTRTICASNQNQKTILCLDVTLKNNREQTTRQDEHHVSTICSCIIYLGSFHACNIVSTLFDFLKVNVSNFNRTVAKMLSTTCSLDRFLFLKIRSLRSFQMRYVVALAQVLKQHYEPIFA